MAEHELPPPIERLTQVVSDVLSVRRVFGDPVTSDRRTVLPVAALIGGHGVVYGHGRGGATPKLGTGEGGTGGGGFGTIAYPLGVYVIDDDGVAWKPSLDLNLVVVGGQVLGAMAIGAVAGVLALRALRSR